MEKLYFVKNIWQENKLTTKNKNKKKVIIYEFSIINWFFIPSHVRRNVSSYFKNSHDGCGLYHMYGIHNI